MIATGAHSAHSDGPRLGSVSSIRWEAYLRRRGRSPATRRALELLPDQVAPIEVRLEERECRSAAVLFVARVRRRPVNDEQINVGGLMTLPSALCLSLIHI